MSRSKFEFDLGEQFPHLPLAPIVEAVIELRARSENTLEPDDFRQQLEESLPDYPNCDSQRELQIEAQFGPEDAARQRRQESWRGFRMMSQDKLSIAQFNRDGFLFSRLQPYQNWESFANEASRLMAVFAQLLAPPEVQRLGVRFINRIAPIELDALGDVMNYPPKCLDSLGLPPTGFLHQTTHTVPRDALEIRIAQTIQQPNPQQTIGFGLILDIDVFTIREFLFDENALKDKLAKMRWLKNKAFFALLTKNAVDSFKEVQP